MNDVAKPHGKSAIRARLDAEKWDKTYPRLRAFAAGRCRSDAMGADLVNEALARIYAPDCAWDPAKEPSVERYLMSVVNSLRINEITSAAVQRNVHIDKVRHAAERVRDDAAPVDEVLSREQIYTRRITLLRARLAEDANALRVLELALEGIDALADIVVATGWTPKVVAAARLRMQRNAAAVAREIGGDDEIALPREDDEDDEEEVA